MAIELWELIRKHFFVCGFPGFITTSVKCPISTLISSFALTVTGITSNTEVVAKLTSATASV